MELIADLHIHSRFSRACSSKITIANLEKNARIKGIDVLGTGDFQHPKWFQELNTLEERDGILYTKTGYPFVWQSEISLIYTQDGKGRKVHQVVLAPNKDAVKEITEFLLSKGRIDYDGRPIFGMSSIEFVERLKSISTDIEIIPAHIWTPWFSLFGSNSGFDSIKDCFQDQLKHIHALETGMSSDPEMNWRISQLDKFNLVSFSDMHSMYPWRMGREATLFDIDLTYKNLIRAIRTKKGYNGTIEVDPNYGKYHVDGHRNCNVVMDPEETKKHNNICPVCKKPLTIGVLSRVQELADRGEGYKPKDYTKYKTLIPLGELISMHLKKGIATKSVSEILDRMFNRFGSEFNILLNVEKKDLDKEVGEKLAEIIIRNRSGEIEVKPGYDGVYGIPQLEVKKNKSLTGF
ncbi:MAG: endonuclease Q family protein [archaeon]